MGGKVDSDFHPYKVSEMSSSVINAAQVCCVVLLYIDNFRNIYCQLINIQHHPFYRDFAVSRPKVGVRETNL